jgi:hypothetical protein
MGIALWLVGACSVFPERAVLPERAGGAGGGAGVTAGSAGAGRGGSGGTAGTGGTAGDGGAVAESGGRGGEAGDSGGLAGEGGGDSGRAGENNGGGGASAGRGGDGGRSDAGSAGSGGCPSDLVTVATKGDAWIDEARQTTEHGADATLSVTGGADERRLLVSFPAAPDRGQAMRAVLYLELVANADLTRASRALRAFSLPGGFDEATVTWTRRSSGADGRWLEKGGDVGVDSAAALVPEETVSGPVAFDVTSLVAASAAGEPLSWLVLESGAPPPSPAALEFAARESAGGGARLELEYCAP